MKQIDGRWEGSDSESFEEFGIARGIVIIEDNRVIFTRPPHYRYVRFKPKDPKQEYELAVLWGSGSIFSGPVLRNGNIMETTLT